MVKINLAFFVPSLIEFIGAMDFPWDRIDLLFSQKLEERKKTFNEDLIKATAAGQETNENDFSIIVESTIYDMIVLAKKGNPTANGYLDFLKKLFEELTDNLTAHEKVLVRSNVKSMLTSFDMKYLNFLGEIAVLNNLIKSKIYRLETIEEKLSNGKAIDFKLRMTESETTHLIEVLNIHLDFKKIDPNPVLIEKFLRDRIAAKILDKTKNLLVYPGLILIPVLWGESKALKIYNDFYKRTPLKIVNTIEPCGYLTYPDGKGRYKHYFEPISTLFK